MTTLGTPDAAEASFDIGGLAFRVVAGIGFLALGYLKLVPSEGSTWVVTFERIGLGLWLMTMTGALQALAGALLLIPRTALGGALLAGATMAGAIVAHLTLLDGIGGAVFPGTILVCLAVVAMKARR
ncbi:MAG: DoxX family protein [Vicinamibacterales bacterium]